MTPTATDPKDRDLAWFRVTSKTTGQALAAAVLPENRIRLYDPRTLTYATLTKAQARDTFQVCYGADRKPAPTSPFDLDAEILTQEQISLVLEGMRTLAGVCDGAARRDGCGFSKLDTDAGKDFAGRDRLSRRQAALCRRKFLVKYQGQLDPALLSVLGIQPAARTKKAQAARLDAILGI